MRNSIIIRFLQVSLGIIDTGSVLLFELMKSLCLCLERDMNLVGENNSYFPPCLSIPP